MNAKFALFAMITLIFTSAVGHAQAVIDEDTFQKRLDGPLYQLQSLGEENKLPRKLDQQELLVQKIVDVIVPLDGRVRKTNSAVIHLFEVGNRHSTIKKLVSHNEAIKKFLDNSQISEDSKTLEIESFRERATTILLGKIHSFNLEIMAQEPDSDADPELGTESPARLADKTNNVGSEVVANSKNSTTN